MLMVVKCDFIVDNEESSQAILFVLLEVAMLMMRMGMSLRFPCLICLRSSGKFEVFASEIQTAAVSSETR
jgi:hypothetical protein